MLSVVVLSSLLISLTSAASCKSITLFGSAFTPIDYCSEIILFGYPMSRKFACGGTTGVLENAYIGSGCNETNIYNSTEYQFDLPPDILYYDCDSSTLCDVTVLNSATCSACTDNDGCTENNFFGVQFGFVTDECMSIPQIYLDAYNANRTVHGKDAITSVAIQFECEKLVGIETVAYDDTECTEKSADQTALQGVAGEEDDDEEIKIGCSGVCPWNCSYVSLTCAADSGAEPSTEPSAAPSAAPSAENVAKSGTDQVTILFAVLTAIFISISL